MITARSFRKFFPLLALVFSFIVFFIFPKWTVDDAYIYFRYANNFAQHGQLNWNVGQPPVEGYTSIVWLIILSAFIKLGVSPVVASHILGIVFYFFGFLMLFLLLKKMDIGLIGEAAGLFFYACTPIIFTHALSGLETMMFFSLLLSGNYLLFVLAMSERKPLWKNTLFILNILLLCFVRPEGIAFGGLLVLGGAYMTWRENRRAAINFLIQSVFFIALPLFLYFIWRHNYYGQWLPNTFYVKTTDVGFGLGFIMDLIRFLFRYFSIPLMLAAILVVSETDVFIKKIKMPVLRPLLLIFSVNIIFSLALAAQYTVSHLSMNFAYRFYLPFLPLFWLASAYFIGNGWQIIADSKATDPLRYRAVFALIIILFVGQLSFYLLKLKEEITFAREEKILLGGEHIAIGKILKNLLPKNEWLVSYIDAGAVPYFAGLKTVDFGGLNDKVLSHNKLTEQERVDYFFSFNPGAVVFTSINSEHLDYGGEPVAARIASDPRFKKYLLFQKFLSPLPNSHDYRDYNEFLYVRGDLIKEQGNVTSTLE